MSINAQYPFSILTAIKKDPVNLTRHSINSPTQRAFFGPSNSQECYRKRDLWRFHMSMRAPREQCVPPNIHTFIIKRYCTADARARENPWQYDPQRSLLHDWRLSQINRRFVLIFISNNLALLAWHFVVVLACSSFCAGNTSVEGFIWILALAALGFLNCRNDWMM